MNINQYSLSTTEECVNIVRRFPERLDELEPEKKIKLFRKFCKDENLGVKVPFILNSNDYRSCSFGHFRILHLMNQYKHNFDEKYFLYPFDIILDLYHNDFDSGKEPESNGSLELLILANLNFIQVEDSNPLHYIYAELKKFMLDRIEHDFSELYHMLEICNSLDISEQCSFTSIKCTNESKWLTFKRIVDMNSSLTRDGIQNPKLATLIRKKDNNTFLAPEIISAILFD